MIPTKNRAYTLAYLAVAGLTLLAVITLWKNPNQYQYVFEWYGAQLLWMVPLVIGSKEIGKSLGNFTSGLKTKFENGANALSKKELKPPQEGAG